MENWSFGIHRGKLDNWPKDENGEMIPPVFLEHISSQQFAAEVDINLLEAYGIPVITQYPNDGAFGKVVIGMSGGGIELYVPETLLDDARNILSGDIIEDDEAENEKA